MARRRAIIKQANAAMTDGRCGAQRRPAAHASPPHCSCEVAHLWHRLWGSYLPHAATSALVVSKRNSGSSHVSPMPGLENTCMCLPLLAPLPTSFTDYRMHGPPNMRNIQMRRPNRSEHGTPTTQQHSRFTTPEWQVSLCATAEKPSHASRLHGDAARPRAPKRPRSRVVWQTPRHTGGTHTNESRSPHHYKRNHAHDASASCGRRAALLLEES